MMGSGKSSIGLLIAKKLKVNFIDVDKEIEKELGISIKKIFEKYGNDVPIVTYCFKGPRGLLAAYQLKKMGFTNVVNLEDGLLNWLGCGKSLKSYFGDITLAKNEK